MDTFYRELTLIVQGNAKFDSFSDNRIWDSAELLVRYGIGSIEGFRTTDDADRKYLFEDLRKAEKKSFLDLALILKLNRHIPPHDQKTSEKNIRFTELDIHPDLPSFRQDLSSIAASIHPEQEMVNWINRQRAIASSKDPPFVPYLVPKLSENPWLPPTAEHSSARSAWMSFSKQARRTASPQELSIHAFTLYQLRFLLSAELCKAFGLFGGLSHQLSHLSTFLNLAVVESVGVALAYHQILITKLQERARQRSSKLEDFASPLKSEDFATKEKAKREIAGAVEKDKRDASAAKENRNRFKQHSSNQSNNAPPKLTRNQTFLRNDRFQPNSFRAKNEARNDTIRRRSRSRSPPYINVSSNNNSSIRAKTLTNANSSTIANRITSIPAPIFVVTKDNDEIS